MKYFAKASLSSLVALSLLPATAQAATYSPTGSGSVVPTTVQVKKGIVLNCVLNANIVSDGTIQTNVGPSIPLPNGTRITSLTIPPGDALCGLVSVAGLPYKVQANSATEVEFIDVRVTGVTGNCRGNLKADLVGGVLKFTHTKSTIPSDPPGGSSCSIQGNVPTNPTASFSYP